MSQKGSKWNKKRSERNKVGTHIDNTMFKGLHIVAKEKNMSVAAYLRALIDSALVREWEDYRPFHFDRTGDASSSPYKPPKDKKVK